MEPKVIRNAKRFATKYYAAQLLSARLYQSEQDLEELKRKIQQTQLYLSGDGRLKAAFNLSIVQLQQWVRASFLCDGNASNELKHFVDTVVRPCLSVSVTAIPEHLVGVMNKYLRILSGTEASEADAASIRIASAALSGQLSQHPLVQGLGFPFIFGCLIDPYWILMNFVDWMGMTNFL